MAIFIMTDNSSVNLDKLISMMGNLTANLHIEYAFMFGFPLFILGSIICFIDTDLICVNPMITHHANETWL